MPETVLFNDGHETRYTYAADGRKLRVQYLLSDIAIIDADKAKGEASTLALDDAVTAPGIGELPAGPAVATLMTRDYCGSHIYRNGRLERTLTDGGYIQDGKLYFYIKDYQGNVRAVLNQQNQPIELTSYYPYGGIMASTAAEGVQPYKYGGKELDRENGLDLYDSRARYYDSQIGRTPTQDPKAESYPHLTPYLWCAANPIRLTDPSGMVIEDPNGYIDNLQSFYSVNYSNILKLLSCSTSLDEKTKSLLKSCAEVYKNKLSELEVLKESDQTYRIEFSSNIDEGEADTNYDPESEKLVTRINSSIKNSPGLVAHEGEHWIQFEFGKLSYNYITGSAGYLYDMTDEIAAYNTQSVVENGTQFQVYNNQGNRIPDYNIYKALIKSASQDKTNNIFRKSINGKRITIKSVDF